MFATESYFGDVGKISSGTRDVACVACKHYHRNPIFSMAISSLLKAVRVITLFPYHTNIAYLILG